MAARFQKEVDIKENVRGFNRIPTFLSHMMFAEMRSIEKILV